MDAKLLELVKSKNNDFSEHTETAHLFYFLNELGGTGAEEINYTIAEKIEKGSIYKNKFNKCYHILNKLYDDRNNIILLCEEIV